MSAILNEQSELIHLNALEKQRLHQLLDDEGHAGLQKMAHRNYGFNLDCFVYSFLRRAVSSFMANRSMKEVEKLSEFLVKEEGNWATFITQLVPQLPTELFRDYEHWQYLRGKLRELRERRAGKLRIWVGGCSTGEVLASVLLMLYDQDMMKRVSVMASNLHARILEQSRKMRFPKSKWTPSMKNYQHMETGLDQPPGIVEEDHYFTIASDLLAPVQFISMAPHQIPKVSFDWILCQNVLLYYQLDIYRKACRNMQEALNSGGLLLLGNSEKLPGELSGRTMKPVLEKRSLYHKTS